MLLPVLDDLNSYERLAARCLTLDIGLKRIEEMNLKKRGLRTEASTSASATTTTPRIAKAVVAPTTPTFRVGTTPDRQLRQSTPADIPATYFNCHKPGHFASSCPEPRKTDFKVIEEEEEELSDAEPVKEEP